MRKPRFTQEQIIAVLKEVEAGTSVEDVCKKHGITDAMFRRWRSEYGSSELSETRRLRQLEEENRRLRFLVADLTLSNQALKLAASKKW